MAHYLDSETYAALVAALVDPIPAPGCDRRDAVIEALGEIGDVWPASIIPDVLKHAPEEASFGEFWPG